MTPFEISAIQELRTEQQSDAALEKYLDGSSDAAMLEMPKHSDTAYLMGWLDAIKKFPTAADGSIIYREGCQLQTRLISDSYQTGAYDAPDCDCGEF